MSTYKIYETDGNAMQVHTTVTNCRPCEGGFAVILEKTVFFPGGGGQEKDRGTIDGITVCDVREENGDIVHILKTPLEKGSKVICSLDRNIRIRRMQNHSGEHIVSGIVNRKYGYNNVGFHMGEDDITIDFDGVLDRTQLDGVEKEANEAIFENRRIIISFPTPKQLETLEYRSKKELTGQVRIVEIEGFDRCACCAPHLAYTGQVGIIKILDFIHYKGGVRVHLLCGFDALDDYNRRYLTCSAISRLLSSPQNEIAEAAEQMYEENGQLKGEAGGLRRKLLTMLADSVQKTDKNICIFENTDAQGMRFLANACVGKCGGICGVFSGDDENGYRYIISARNTDLKKKIPEINAALRARGGGYAQMIQGSSAASAETIKAFFEK